MRSALVLRREAGDRWLPKDMLVRRRATRGRPPVTYDRIRIRTLEEAEKARAAGVPVLALTPAIPARYHYPMRFPTRLAVAEQWVDRIETPFLVLPVHDPELLQNPGLAEYATLMLQVSEFAARAMILRNPKEVDPALLTHRIMSERQQRAATTVNLQEFVPAIPKLGKRLPLQALREEDRNNLSGPAWTILHRTARN